MDRSEASQLDNNIRKMLMTQGTSVNWVQETGQIVLKRDGSVKLSYSERDSVENARKMKELISEYLVKCGFTGFKISLTNMLDTYRPEVRVTVTIK